MALITTSINGEKAHRKHLFIGAIAYAIALISLFSIYILIDSGTYSTIVFAFLYFILICSFIIVAMYFHVFANYIHAKIHKKRND